MSTEWSAELNAFTRAFAGVAIFGIPLVFTMEMWWIGKTIPLLMLIVLMFLGFFANFGLARIAGFRRERSLGNALDQAVDAMAVGIIGATILLIVLHQLRWADGLGPGLGMVMLQAVPLSLGASVAGEVFFGREGREDGQSSDESGWQPILNDVGATVIGGVFIGISIAPTDEVKMIAAGLTDWYVLAMIGLSLFLSYLIVFASGFDEGSPEGAFHHPFSETVYTYAISLLVAFALLLIFRRISLDDHTHEIVRRTLVLALPVSIGGAAGRLVI